MCHLSPEGVILGADSTSSTVISPVPGYNGFHYFNYNQKVFEVGQGSSLGVITWGLGGFGSISHRRVFALAADEIEKSSGPVTVQDAANLLCDKIWSVYSGAELAPLVTRCKSLSTKAEHDPSIAPDPGRRTQPEEAEFQRLKGALVAGFCLGGYALPDRGPRAFELLFDPLSGKPTPIEIPQNAYKFWGAPNMIRRLIFGWDPALKASILRSGKWTGTEAELAAVLDQQKLAFMLLPIRDAVDFVHACIYSTIKALKFSNLFQICGGPIEIAVITSDRKFRWVRHKQWDAAITEG